MVESYRMRSTAWYTTLRGETDHESLVGCLGEAETGMKGLTKQGSGVERWESGEEMGKRGSEEARVRHRF